MLKIRKKDDRGATKLNWLDSRHSFSFADYYDPAHMGFGHLRVINDDIVAPDSGFATHPHRDMEIVTVVLDGTLEHQDSMGNTMTIRAGDVQRMTAGTGILHSEMNPSSEEPVHFLQIWILTNQKNLTPEYEKTAFSRDDMRNRLHLIVSNGGKDGSLHINQDVNIYQTLLEKGKTVTHKTEKDKKYWLQTAQGSAGVNGHILNAGDGIAVEKEETELKITGRAAQSNLLLFEIGGG